MDENKGLNKGEIAEEVKITLEHDLKNKSVAKVGFWSFIAMIFMTVYGMVNGQQIYYQMGYAGITYVLLGLLLFFIPYTFIVSEMSSAFHEETGGILSWMTKSVGLKFGAVGAFMWYIAAVMWWFGSLSYLPISLSSAMFGKDVSETWKLFGLSNGYTTALIATIALVLIVIFSIRGIKSISFITNISMLSVVVLHIVILGGGLVVFAMSGFHFEQAFHPTGISSFFLGPNTNYSTAFEGLGFLVFIIFFFGGMEASGGLVDKVKNPKKTVPKAMVLSGIIIAVLYVSIILISGMVDNWNATFNSANVSLGNFSIYMTQQQFLEFGQLIGMSHTSAIALGQWVNRLVAILGLIAMLNFPIMLYYPIKQIYEGVPKGMIPKFLTKENKFGVPQNAIFFEVIIIVLGIWAFHTGAAGASMYNTLNTMITIVTSLPWAFIVFAYIRFKKNDNIKKEYQFFNKTWGIIIASITLVTLIFVDIFSVLGPLMQAHFSSAAWSQAGLMIGGPVIFGVIGFILAWIYENRVKKGTLKSS
ncbi:MAG: amino acid permease [Sarcina sp.]